MSKDDDEISDSSKPVRVEISDQVLEAMAGDPEMAKAIEHFTQTVKKADELVKAGKFATLDAAMASLGMKSELIEPGDVPEDVAEKIAKSTVSTRH